MYGVDVSVYGSLIVGVLCGVCCSCRGMVGVMPVVPALRGPELLEWFSPFDLGVAKLASKWEFSFVDL